MVEPMAWSRHLGLAAAAALAILCDSATAIAQPAPAPAPAPTAAAKPAHVEITTSDAKGTIYVDGKLVGEGAKQDFDGDIGGSFVDEAEVVELHDGPFGRFVVADGLVGQSNLDQRAARTSTVSQFVAIASDENFPGAGIPTVDINDIAAVAELILARAEPLEKVIAALESGSPAVS